MEDNKKTELTKRERRRLDDRVQLEKTIITEDDRAVAEQLSCSGLELVKKGTLSAIRARNLLATIGMLFVVAGALVGAALLVIYSEKTRYFAYGAIACLLIAVFMLALIMTRYRYMRDIKTAELADKVIFSVSLKHTPYFVSRGEVYELRLLETGCPTCIAERNEVRGDMHIERVDGVLVAVCNYNRKHFYLIDEGELSKNV